MSSILIATPILRDMNGRGRVFARALTSHLALDWSGYLDSFQITGGDNYLDGGATVTAKYNRARDVFLAGNWTHFMALETDMIVPRDAIHKLLALDCQIAYGLYVFRHLSNREWNAAQSLERLTWKSFSKDAQYARSQWGQRVDSVGVGLGCTLIRRDVLEAAPFRYWKGVNCDWALAYDAQMNGWTQRHDLSLVCGHMSLTPSPCILWPDVNTEKSVRIEYPK